jgi:hypothetical protein
MTNQTNVELDTSKVKAKAIKTKETISFLSTAVPLLGVLGTAFVWIAANFYVGTVDIQPAGEYQEISVQVFDQKGAEQQFHTPHFLLQPGKYHIAISVDKNQTHHLDTEVALGKTANIKVVEASATQSETTSEQTTSKKHWWQIWKKSSPEKSESPTSHDAKETK